MSHKATCWAVEQRGISPAAKVVLWQLCDRFHPERGCFPSQELLAADCEMSRSGLNNQLDALEAAGLIRRERQRDEATNRQLRTRYRFPFEPSFYHAANAAPCPNAGHGAVSTNPAEPSPKNEESRVQLDGHKPVIEPVNEPLRESAREDEEGFERVRRAWPTGFADSREVALAAWQELTDDERRDALAEIERFVTTTRAAGRKFFGTLGAYLSERKWTALPERPTPSGSRADQAARITAVPRSAPTAFQRANPHLYPELFANNASIEQ